VVSVRHIFARTHGTARNIRLTAAEAILADYYQDILAHNVALRSLRELGYTEQQASSMLDRTRELRAAIPTR
jgi:hypothetical protein